MFLLCSELRLAMAGSNRVIPFYSLGLRDLVYPKAVLVVRCGTCQTKRDVRVIPVLAQRGPDYGVLDLEKVFACSACLRRGFAIVRVVWF